MTTPVRIAALGITFLSTVFHVSEGLTFPLTGNVSAGIGQKWRTEPSFPQINVNDTRNAWEPMVNVTLGPRAIPIALEGYASRTRKNGHSDKTNDDLLQETRTETGVGVAGIKKLGPIYSHLGAGLATISSNTKSLVYTNSPKESFSETGHWIGGGVLVPLGGGFNIDAVVRYTNVDRHFDPGYPSRTYELGGVSANALVGWGWMR